MTLNDERKEAIVNSLNDIIRSFEEETEPVHEIRERLLSLVDRLYCEEYAGESLDDNMDDE